MSWVSPCCKKSTSIYLQMSLCLGLHLSDLAQQISSCLDALIFCGWTLFPPVSDEYLNIKQGSDASRHACAQGNEFSYYMLLTSSFMLNYCERVQQWTIFPWALTSCNQPNSAAQLRAVSLLIASCIRSFLRIVLPRHWVARQTSDCIYCCLHPHCLKILAASAWGGTLCGMRVSKSFYLALLRALQVCEGLMEVVIWA